MPAERRTGNGKSLTIKGARENNLKSIDVELPLGLLICITGVFGSGKSSLAYEVLYKKLAQLLYRGRDLPGDHDELLGLENIDKVVNIDQSPIGRTPRSNPATYTGAFTPIRELFASLPEARVRGYAPGRFSFNVKGGRCEACQGEGYNQIEMQFLPDVTVPCEVCQGRRYNREALEVTMRDRSIADVLSMTVDQALEFFFNFPRIKPKLETLRDVGSGLHPAGATRHHSVRRRGPAGKAVHRVVPPGDRQDAVPVGRAHHRSFLPGLRRLAASAAPFWWIAVTRCCSSSTTWTSLRTATGSSTWGPARATRAGTSLPPERRNRWPGSGAPTPANICGKPWRPPAAMISNQ